MTKKTLFAWTVLVSFAISSPGLAAAQETADPSAYKTPAVEGLKPAAPAALPAGVFKPQGTVIRPASDVAPVGKAHTTYKLFQPAGRQLSSIKPDYTFAETPASIGCVYRAGPDYAGCNPSTGGTRHPTGGWGAIALVDAYDYPQAASDLAYFDSYWGLGTANFKTIIANSSFGTLGTGLTASCSGTPPSAYNYGWDVEEALDIEWAHTLAPDARVFLVEACSNSYTDLLYAEEVAGIEVSKYGGGDISNSWGGGESSSQLGTSGYDNNFYRYYWSDITYFASAGDSGGEVIYPSSNPWVVSAGGTTINRDANGNFLSESCWSDSGGGFSTIETWANPESIYNGLGPWNSYQYPLFGGAPYASPYRSTPDISWDADPNSGVYVYDSNYGWLVVGGTSVSSPSLAGFINASDQHYGQATTAAGGYYEPAELFDIYSVYKGVYNDIYFWYDVTTGSNGNAAGVGYDQCTGVGSPRFHYTK
jgi:kumamolisin